MDVHLSLRRDGLLFFVLLISVMTWASGGATARAEDRASQGRSVHALLIGAGTYHLIDEKYHLEGPGYDVSALKGLLINSWGLETGKITTLVDNRATRKNILAALERLDRETRPGDFVFIYFSGHGTSCYDPQSKGLGLDPFTGALVPADFRFGGVEDMRERLIVGVRDLKPRLKRLEKGRLVLALFDACYSGCTVRGVRDGGRWKTRNLSIPWEELPGIGPGECDVNTMGEPAYPYRNVVYISASSRREVAVEITRADIAGGRKTMDGLPHGAFTDGLLRGLSGKADTNHDGAITIAELYGYVRREVSARFPHTPGLLYSGRERAAINEPLFGRKIEREIPSRLISPDRPLRVKVEGASRVLKEKIAGLEGARLVTADYDILVTADRDMYGLYLPNGYFLTIIPGRDPDLLVERLARQVRIKELVGLSFLGQSFNVFVELTGPDGVLMEGDSVGFRVGADEDGFILLINIDPTGLINVIYPSERGDLSVTGRNMGLNLPGVGEVVSPFGSEYIKAFAFRDRPAGLEKMIGGTFGPGDERFSELMNMVQGPGGGVAQMTIGVKTCGKGDVLPAANHGVWRQAPDNRTSQ